MLLLNHREYGWSVTACSRALGLPHQPTCSQAVACSVTNFCLHEFQNRLSLNLGSSRTATQTTLNDSRTRVARCLGVKQKWRLISLWRCDLLTICISWLSFHCYLKEMLVLWMIDASQAHVAGNFLLRRRDYRGSHTSPAIVGVSRLTTGIAFLRRYEV